MFYLFLSLQALAYYVLIEYIFSKILFLNFVNSVIKVWIAEKKIQQLTANRYIKNVFKSQSIIDM